MPAEAPPVPAEVLPVPVEMQLKAAEADLVPAEVPPVPAEKQLEAPKVDLVPSEVSPLPAEKQLEATEADLVPTEADPYRGADGGRRRRPGACRGTTVVYKSKTSGYSMKKGAFSGEGRFRPSPAIQAGSRGDFSTCSSYETSRRRGGIDISTEA